MAQELELIVELLREMKNANYTNSQSFDNLFAGISNKIDVMGRNSASAELLKAYLGELAKNIDDKYSTTQSRFTEIEKALSAMFKVQDEHVKNKEIKELFEIFTTNLNNFYSESRQQKAILSGIETRLADISTDKSDKEDILRTITLLRNDFENLNHSYKSAIDSVNTDLKTIISNMIKLDQTETNAKISEQVEIMYKATSDIVNYLTSIDKRDENLEKILSNVATNESLKLTQGVIDSIIKKSEEISEKLTTLADKTDINGLEVAASIMNNKLDEVVTKELFTKIATETDALISQTDEIKQSLADVTKNIDAQPDTRMFEDALQNLFKQFESLSQDINKLDYAENITEIDNRINTITNELAVIKNIASDINEAVMSKVLTAIDDISFENQSYDIKNHISRMLSELPQKEDIDRILENDLLNKSAVETLLEKTDILADKLDNLPTHQDMATLNNNQLSLVENLQDVANKSDIESLEAKADEIEEMIDNLNFDDEFEQLYDKTSSIENWLVDSKLKEKSDEILSQFPTKANQKDIIEILSTSKKIATDLEELSKNTDAKKVNRTVSEVYSMIEDLKNDFINTTEMHNDSIIVALSELQQSASNIVTVEDFDRFSEDLKTFIENLTLNLEALKTGTATIDTSITEIKELLETKKSQAEEIDSANNRLLSQFETYVLELKTALDNTDANTQISSRLANLEEILSNLKSTNEETLSQIISRLENLQNVVPSDNLEDSASELSEIKNQIKTLGGSFNSLSFNKDSNENNISEFISEKLDELSSDIEKQINNGFIYNTELIEEKTALMLDLIKELRHSNSGNIDMYERLTVADNKLIDFKQELELVNTDIVNNINERNEVLIKELTPIKELLSNMLSNMVQSSFRNISEPLEVVRESVKETVLDSAATEKLEEIYTKISNEISANENNLRDFVLSDIDSVLIKIDTLKSDLESTLSAITPADVSDIKEFREFAAQVNDFRKEQQEFFEKISTDIQTSISEQFVSQREDIKSLLAVYDNSSAIIDAIENLRHKIEFSSSDGFEINDYEKEFEKSKLSEIKEDFEKFSTLLSELSDKNPELEEVLNAIKTKLDSDSTDERESEIDIIDEESDNFDIVKALELLQEDIKNLQNDIKTTGSVDKTWLEEVKNYIAGDDIRAMLAQINSKIDVLALSDNTDWVDDIKQVISDLGQTDISGFIESNAQIQSILNLINEKIDILAATDNSADFEDIRFTLDSIESKLSAQENDNEGKKLSESDAKITSMLEVLNHKIDVLASYDDSETQFALEDVKALILEQKDNLDKLDNNNNTDAFKKCLDELTVEVNNINSNNSQEIQKSLKDMKESIMAAVVTIFEQVSFIEETEDIKDFVEEKTNQINKNLFEVTEQLKQITNTDTDYSYSMQDIESDLAKLRIALKELQDSEQDTNSEQLTFIIDNINRIGTTVEDLQSTISQEENVSDSIGKIINDQLSTKVDRVTKLIERSNNSDKVMRQALIYIGEWIDSTSERMNKISTNSDEIIDVKTSIEGLKSIIPQHTNILNSIEEKFDEQQERLAFFEKQINKLCNMEDRFEQQQERIDRLEMSLEKILSAVEEIDDSKVTRKIDKIDKQLLKLSTNIEKLASYVD